MVYRRQTHLKNAETCKARQALKARTRRKQNCHVSCGYCEERGEAIGVRKLKFSLNFSQAIGVTKVLVDSQTRESSTCLPLREECLELSLTPDDAGRPAEAPHLLGDALGNRWALLEDRVLLPLYKVEMHLCPDSISPDHGWIPPEVVEVLPGAPRCAYLRSNEKQWSLLTQEFKGCFAAITSIEVPRHTILVCACAVKCKSLTKMLGNRFKQAVTRGGLKTSDASLL